MTKARDIADLGAVTSRLDTVGASDGALSNRNVIVNGEFSVSQRGTYTSATVMADNAYTLDRWKTYRGAGTATFQDMGGSLKLTATSAYTGTLSIRQYVEWLNLKTRVGQTFTLSAYMKTTSSNARVLIYDGTDWTTGATAHSGSGQWELVTLTFTMPDASSYGSLLVAVGIDGIDSANVSISNGENVEIKQVQLEVGDTATPFEHRSYGDELARCQRYFRRLSSEDGAYTFFTWGQSRSASSADLFYYFSVPMRAAPTFSFSALADFYLVYGTSVNAPTLLELSTGYKFGVTIRAEKSGQTIGQAASLTSANRLTSYLDFSAEL